MRLIVQVFAISAVLASFPAMAADTSVDRLSQTYTERDPAEVRAQRDREQTKREEKKTSACDTSCACGHKGSTQEHSKA